MCKRFCYALLAGFVLVAGAVNAQDEGAEKKAEKVEIPKGEGTPVEGAPVEGAPLEHQGGHIAPAPGCGGAIGAPAAGGCGASVSYRTVYHTEWVRENYTENVTRYRHVTQKVPYTAYRYVSVPQTKTRTYTVYRRVPSYHNVCETVTDNVWTTETKTVMKRVRRTVTETHMVTKTVDRGHWEWQCVEAGPSFMDRMGGLFKRKNKGGCCDPCDTCCEPVRMKRKRVWVSCKECVQCPVTRTRCVWECVPTTCCVKVCKPVTRQVTRKVCTYKCIPETKTETYTVCCKKCVPYTCHRCVTKCVPYTECVTRCRMVPKCVARQVAVCNTGCDTGCGGCDTGCGGCDTGCADTCCEEAKCRKGGLFSGGLLNRGGCGGGLFSGGLFSGGLFGGKKSCGGDDCCGGYDAGCGGCCN